ncbi:MAG: ribosome maturation factor RimM [Tractidigestivibacter sp.]|uniref:ribosome maturation factor RimM n=1 Tax=Tractidigestivibacter sp. TaxID=2847320 RepID=UPI003D8D91F4
MEKPHGRRGEVVTVPVHGLPRLMREGLKVFVVPPHLKGPRSFVVSRVSEGSGAGQLVSFEGVSSIAAAERLVGRQLLACEDDLPKDISLHDASAILGREVIDPALGELGIVEEVMVGPANDVWVIEGRRGELLLPVIDSVVSEVPSKGAITVNVPDGLGFESEGGESA